jgi:hypothetical protein
MATVEKLGGNWVIVRVYGMPAPDDTSSSTEAQENASSANREFWTGDCWASQYGLAKQFAVKEGAETYLAQHRQKIA